MQTKDPSLDQIASIQRNLTGVPRVFLSGGEPLPRRDFVEIVDIFHDHIEAVLTNATRGHFMAPKLVGKVSFINVGLEGPRNTTNRVRGDYEKVMRGILAFKEVGPGGARDYGRIDPEAVELAAGAHSEQARARELVSGEPSGLAPGELAQAQAVRHHEQRGQCHGATGDQWVEQAEGR